MHYYSGTAAGRLMNLNVEAEDLAAHIFGMASDTNR